MTSIQRLLKGVYQPTVRGLHAKKKRRRKKALKAWRKTVKGMVHSPHTFLSHTHACLDWVGSKISLPYDEIDIQT